MVSELRWLERNEPVILQNLSPSYKEITVIRRVEILQYRLLFLPTLTASGEITLYKNPDPKWLDIPLVKESNEHNG